jgi:photosystem II stability/assembly factor-like uncharacterized protein
MCDHALWTENGGTHWIESTTVDSMTFIDLGFANRTDGLLIAYAGLSNRPVILRTYDGGQHWELTNAIVGDTLYQVVATNQTFAYVRSNTGLWRTTDLGDSWVAVTCPAVLATSNLSFCNDLDGYADTDIGMFRTTDGGIVWTIMPDPLSGKFALFGFSNPSCGIGVMNDYTTAVYATTDGGNNWTITQPFGRQNVHAIEHRNSNKWWAVGDRGLVAVSNDAGRTWHSQISGSQPFLNIAPYDSLHLWLVTPAQQLVRTRDGGRTYDTLTSAPSGDIGDVVFTNPANGWIVGRTVLYHTTDGGDHWSQNYTLPHGGVGCRDFNFFDSTNIAFGVHYEEYGHDYWHYHGFVRSSDGGASWSEYENNEWDISYNTVFVGQNFGWAGGYDVAVYRTTSGPENWYSCFNINDHGGGYMGGIYAINRSNCWVLTSGSGPFETRDGGITWVHRDFDNYGRITFSRNKRFGMMMGNDSTIFSSDSGDTWTAFPFRRSMFSFYSNIRISDDGDVWAITSDQMCIQRFRPPHDPHAVSANTSEPGNFRLSAYPNPFNGAANLNYTLSRRCRVQYGVYDVLGRIVDLRDIGIVEPGSHRQRIDGAAWSSGIYFVRLNAGNQIQTLKIFLLK